MTQVLILGQIIVFSYFNKKIIKCVKHFGTITPPNTPPNTTPHSPTPIQFSQIRNNTRPTGVLNPGLITP